MQEMMSWQSWVWMTKARSSLIAVKTPLEESLFAEARWRSYYAMFYAAKALIAPGWHRCEQAFGGWS